MVALDRFGKRGKGVKPLTYRAASLVLVIEAVVVAAVLSVVVAGSQLPDNLVLARLTPDTALIAALWVIGLVLVQRAASTCPGTTRATRRAPRPIPTATDAASPSSRTRA